MKDTRLSSTLHLLLHMAHSQRPLTSDELADMLGTNAVVVRRTLAGLRELGYISSGKGRGGGWTLACDLRRLTLRDVYRAVGAPPLFAMGHRSDNPECLVEQAVNHALGDTLAAAQALVDAQLERITLADLAADFEHRLSAHPCRKESHDHAKPKLS
jgi:DNA-binding IscR family transcriptional regulator